MGEFFDTAERLLNQEQPGQLWSNFGYWQDARSYPQACRALACLLADRAGLGPGQQVLDLGFGMGEQLRLWADDYAVRQLTGLNPSSSQCRQAAALQLPAGFTLHCDGAEAIGQYLPAASCDVVIALDCAYHFSRRTQVWQQIAQVLKPGGVLVLSDLLRPQAAQGLRSQSLRRALCAVCRIPPGNLLDQIAYRQQLAGAGLHLSDCEDISAQVFIPFARWWQGYRRQYRVPPRQYAKFALTAAAAERLGRSGLLQYHLLLARKPA